MRRALVISICLHLFAFLTWIAALKFGPSAEEKKVKPEPFWVEIQPPPLLKIPPKVRNRLVQTAARERVKEPEANSFLGRENQRVVEETVASVTSAGSSKKLGSNKPEKSEAAIATRNPVAPTLSHLGIKWTPPSLARAKDEPVWDAGDAQPNEYIKGMKESGQTALNTKSYIFYSYFQRIRESLDRAWVPIIRNKLMAYYRSGRHLASEMDHLTRTVVTLNGQGEIVRVKLIEKSGTEDLDEAAIDAFNQAGPFPNPPIGMIDTNHEVQVPWDFILRS